MRNAWIGGFWMVVWVTVMVMVTINGCAHVGISKDEYREGIDQIKFGMSKAEFFEVFPEAVLKAAKPFPNNNPPGIAELIEVDVEYNSAGEYARVAYAWTRAKDARRVWFYFFNDQLQQYGTADSWDSFNPGDHPDKSTIGR